MSSGNVCDVPWCVSLVNGSSRYCPVHTANRVEYNEKQGAWLNRIRAEERAAKKAAADEALKQATGR